ncbi:KpsF/GutQ family sugar-phosphate isomerase [Nitratifractor salsuginis]|uniref:KpsF/GutQ family protein n=1 Tax=Nitratifractor salsuginis (strain DSM 16511 / JCM 12458 / E9I37-1) TaxID=749222 RepID=E6WY84_NITSE|nr:KpsF/GutQ family sugar-phosphate isomerase [Nitratifractor salsuginis]ADV45332.1 KpsF/GutQ family protein [Nitratifractor salsuginis DSM 16511]
MNSNRPDTQSLVESARETLQIEAQALLSATDRIDTAFVEAVESIYALKGKLIVTGIGKSGLVGAKIAATLASTGTSSFFLHPSEALHGDLGMIGPEDGVLAISYSGESEELSNILPHIRRFGIPLLAMTAGKSSTLARYADTVLDISVEREACPLGAAPTASTTLTMALGDALAVALMKKRNFKKEDFASFHPGGSLGRRLFVKVADLMRREDLPIVEAQTPLKEAIVTMSEGKLGNVLITREGRLEAIMSDGDLRRALMRTDFDMERPVIDYATPGPKAIRDTSLLASDALALIEAAKVQLLPVLDEEDRIHGVIHLHDLVSAGIKSEKV